MTRRKLFFAVVACLAATPLALAAPPKGGHGAADQSPDEKEVARSVELGGLVFPVWAVSGTAGPAGAV